MLVYKYMPTDRFFTNLKFRLTPAEDLNDPQELVPDIRIRNPDEYVDAIIARNIAGTYWRVQFANPTFSAAEVWQRCRAAAEQFKQGFDHEASVRDIFESYMRTTNHNVGVLSLTEDPCSGPMWAHYGANSSGFVVGLDSESEFFQPKPKEPKTCGELMSVTYTDTIPVVYVEPGKLDISKEIFFTKSSQWSYEREWRMIKFLPQADEVVDVGGKKIHLFSVPPNAIREVIFGSKVEPTVLKAIKDDLSTRIPHAQPKQAIFVRNEGLKLVNL